MLYDGEPVLLSVVWKYMVDSLKNIAVFSLYPYFFEVWFCRSFHKELEFFSPPLESWLALTSRKLQKWHCASSQNRPQEACHTLFIIQVSGVDEDVMDKTAELSAYWRSMNELKQEQWKCPADLQT